ncbi:WD40 repeat-like protein [Suillus weaverae]|nr:WD40 repeat-like protein [Suillus weaverae]
MSSSTSKTPAITPRHTMRGHTHWVTGVVHLPCRRRIITCSVDRSLRLWDLESGTQIDGNTVASGSGSGDNNVRLWNVEARKVIVKWTGHTNDVSALCWSGDGNRVASGSWDGTARVWDVRSGKNVLRIKTGHKQVCAVMYSPDATKIATSGHYKNVVKIWNAKTVKLFKTLKHDHSVQSLAWTSDGEKLISGSIPIRIFDTTTWQQIAVLEGHKSIFVTAISLSRNDCLLASASWDHTARLWDLDTNLQVGPPLQHKDSLLSAALSADGKALVTGPGNGRDTTVHTWDVHAILKEVGLEDLLLIYTTIPSHGDPGIKHTSRFPISDKSFFEADATQCHDEFGDELPSRFFDGMEADVDSYPMSGVHPRFSASALLARLSSLFCRFRPEATELPQHSTPSGLHPRVLFARLSSLIHHFPPENDAPNELHQPSKQ